MKYRLLFAILIIGFLLKVLFILQMDNTILSFGDARDYDTAAMSVLEKHQFPASSSLPFFRAPFYSVFLAFLYLFSPQNYLLVKIVQAFLITLSGFFLFRIAISFFSRTVALIATALFSLHPYFLLISADLQTESLFFFLTILALYLLIKFANTKGKFSLLFLSGCISAVAILTRPTFVIFLPISLLWLFIIKKEIGSFFKAALILIFSSALLLSPWIIRNRLLFNEFIFCNNAGGYNFFIANSAENYERLTTKAPQRFTYLNYQGLFVDKTNQQIEEFEKSTDYYGLAPKAKEALWYSAAFIYIKNNKLQWLKLLFLKMWEYLKPYLHPFCYPKQYVIGSLFINGIIFLFGIKGLFLTFRDKQLQKIALLFSLYFLASIVVHMVYISANRFRIVYIDPYLYLFAAYAVMKLIRRKPSG